jgi:DNA (cytosine-5)-methyltransferase 1
MSVGITPKEMEGLAPDDLPAATRAYWPTPNAAGGTGYMSGSRRDTWRPTLEGAARMAPTGEPPLIVAAKQRAAREMWPTPHGMCVPNARQAGPSGNELGRAVNRAAFPSPKAADAKGGDYTRDGRTGVERPLLTGAARSWPTPKASPSGPDFARMNRPDSGGDDLATAVAREMLPTPSSRDWKSGAASEATHERNSRPLNEVVYRIAQVNGTGSLNPDWVELLMGWPLGWTRPGPLPDGTLAAWLAADRRAAWDDGSWEGGVPRLATKVPHRVARLRALGNGWVPDQAAMAIRHLVGALEALPETCASDLLE